MKGDPEIKITDADRKIWYDTAMELHEMQAKANDAADVVQNGVRAVSVAAAADARRDAPAERQAVARRARQGARSVRRRLGLGGGGGGGGGFGGGNENVRGRIGQLKGASWRRPRCRPPRS